MALGEGDNEENQGRVSVRIGGAWKGGSEECSSVALIQMHVAHEYDATPRVSPVRENVATNHQPENNAVRFPKAKNSEKTHWA